MLTVMAMSLLLLIALLAIPVTLTFHASWQKSLQGNIQLQWAWGFVSARFPLVKSAGATEQEEKQTTNNIQQIPANKNNLLTALQHKKLRQRIIKFIRDFWHAIHKTNLKIQLRIGLDDPADTGQLWGFVGPVSGILSGIREANINIEPDFLDSTFELDGQGTIRFVPLKMLYLISALLLSPSVWQGVKQTRKKG